MRTTTELKEQLNELFSEFWGEEADRIDIYERDFMTAIRDTLYNLTKNPANGNDENSGLLVNSYDADLVLEPIIVLIEKFNNLYHMLDISRKDKPTPQSIKKESDETL